SMQPNFAMAMMLAVLVSVPDSSIEVSAQSPNVAYDSNMGPTFYDVSFNYSDSKAYDAIEDVDFRNRVLRIFNDRGKTELTVRLKSGLYEERSNFGMETVKLSSIHYLPSHGSDRQYGVVLYSWFSAGGSSSTEGIAQVYEFLGHHLRLVQQLEWDEHFDSSKP